MKVKPMKPAQKVVKQIFQARKLVLLFSLFALILLTLPACTGKNGKGPTEAEQNDGQGRQDEKIQAAFDKEAFYGADVMQQNRTASILAVGDVLIHDSLIHAAEREDGAYDFSPLFRYISPFVAAHHLAAFDMEGILKGPPYAGYPAFSTPESVADALRDIGFDYAITANNHALDFDVPGMKKSVESLREKGLKVIGTRVKPEEESFFIVEINGIKIGLTAFTYESSRVGAEEYRSLNSVPFTEEAAKLIDSVYVLQDRPDLIEKDGKRVEARIHDMREAGAEAIVVFFHWGTEYRLAEDHGQIYYSQLLANNGVDVVFGSGPHIIQPIRSISAEEGNHDMLCFYSMGNFVSNQQFETGNSNGHAQDGLMASVTFEKTDQGEVQVKEGRYLPCTVYKEYPKGKEIAYTEAVVVPIFQALEDIEAYSLSQEAVEEIKAAYARVQEVMEKNNLEEFRVEEYQRNWH